MGGSVRALVNPGRTAGRRTALSAGLALGALRPLR